MKLKSRIKKLESIRVNKKTKILVLCSEDGIISKDDEGNEYTQEQVEKLSKQIQIINYVLDI